MSTTSICSHVLMFALQDSWLSAFALIHCVIFCRLKEVTKSPIRFLPEHSSLSRHLERLTSPVRPLILPYHAEQVAMAYAEASISEATSESSCTPPQVEQYFDVVAVVDRFCNNSDLDS